MGALLSALFRKGIKMKKIVLTALLGITSLFAAMDQWVESGEMIRYRHDTHFSAVGHSAESMEAAKNSAVAAVRKQISVTVKATEINREFDMIDGAGSHKKSNSYQNRTRLAAGGDMQGTEIIETAKRPDGYYAFAALSKELFVKNGRAHIGELNKELKKHYKAAQKATVGSDVVTVLSEVGAARKVLSEIHTTRTLLTAATVLTDKDSPKYTKGDLDALYESVIASIEVKKSVGDKQEVLLGAVPAEPFIVNVSAHGQPVPFMPFVLKNSDGKEVMARSTNVSGDVVFFLGEDARTSKGKHTYKVVPAIKITGEMKSRTRELTSRFSYTVIGDASFAKVSVKLPKDLEPGRETLEAGVTAMLAGYDIIADSCACQTVEVELSVDKGEYIGGVSESRTYQKSSVDAIISVMDRKGRKVYSITKSAQGTGSDLYKSAAKAVELLRIKEDIKDMKSHLTGETAEPLEAPLKKKIVIFDFHNSSNISGWYETADGITAMITTGMINTGYFEVIERNQISEIIKEKNFAGDDLDFAKLAGADYAVVGNASGNGSKIEIDARMVQISDGTVVGAASATGHRMSDLRRLSDQLIKELKIDGKPLKSFAVSGGDCCN